MAITNNSLRVLLTGGTGLLGRHLAPLLAEEHHLTHFHRRDPEDGRPWIPGSLTDPAALAEACRGQDAIVHLAALHGSSWRAVGDHEAFAVNVLGTWHLLQAAVAAGVSRVVFASSIWAAGHGTSPLYLPIDEDLPRDPVEAYGLSKWLGERLCHCASERHGLITIALRVGGIVPAERYDAANPRYRCGAVDVRDVAEAHRQALHAAIATPHVVYNITGPVDEPPVDAQEWYSIERAGRELGYRPRFGSDNQNGRKEDLHVR